FYWRLCQWQGLCPSRPLFWRRVEPVAARADVSDEQVRIVLILPALAAVGEDALFDHGGDDLVCDVGEFLPDAEEFLLVLIVAEESDVVAPVAQHVPRAQGAGRDVEGPFGRLHPRIV